MATPRLPAAAAGALACGAAACWVSFGAIAFLDTTPDSRYAGILPSPAWLLALLAAASLAALVWRPSARRVAPLWLTAVLLVPWLPLRLPTAAFMWSGRLTVWVWLAALAGVLVPAVRSSAIVTRIAMMPPRRAAALAGVLALAAYTSVAFRTAPQHPSGDEPHYLVMTQSLLQDGDLQIENNHRSRDYASYYAGDLQPDFVRRGVNGAIYSSHAPGVAVLVLPAFALFGYPGAVALLVIMSALTAAVTWWMTWQVTGRVAAGWFAWAVMLSAPVLLMANAVFPDSVAPLFVVLALLPIIEPRARTPLRLAAIGGVVTALPWMHTRLTIVAVALGAAIVLRLLGERDRGRQLGAFLTLPVAGAAAWFGFFWTVYGTFDPTAPIGKRLMAPLLAEGLAGLLFDQKFGLLVAAPVALCSAAGVALMLVRGPRRLGLEWLAIVGPYVLAIAAWDMWWGGVSPPARFLVPILPLLALASGVAVSDAASPLPRVASAALLLVSLLIAGTMAWVNRGALIFSDRPDVSPLHAWLSPAVDLTRALPDAFADSPAQVVTKVSCWFAAFAIAALIARGLRRVPRLVALGLAGELTATVAVALLWTQDGGPVRKPFDSGAVLVSRLSPDAGQIGVSSSPLALTSAVSVAREVVLARLDHASVAEGTLATPPLPAGTYELSGTLSDGHRGGIAVRTDRRSPPIVQLDAAVLSASWTQRFMLPVDVPGLRVELDEAADTCVQKLALRLAEPMPRASQPFPRIEAGHGARYGSTGVYYMTGRAWLEGPGIWVGGREGAEFAVLPEGDSLHLMLRNGGVANQIAMESGSWRAILDLQPGETTTIEVPASRSLAATPLRVVPRTGFRPSKMDPSSRDDRLLGVWMEPVS